MFDQFKPWAMEFVEINVDHHRWQLTISLSGCFVWMLRLDALYQKGKACPIQGVFNDIVNGRG